MGSFPVEPIMPQEKAGPLSAMILPILISASLAPGSYFFCAFTAVAISAAAVANPSRQQGLACEPASFSG
jgi:hypothetical protein